MSFSFARITLLGFVDSSDLGSISFLPVLLTSTRPFCEAQLFIDFLNLLLKLSFLFRFLGSVPVFPSSTCGSAWRLLKEAGRVLYLSSLSGNFALILKSFHFFSSLSLLDLENLDPISVDCLVSDLKVNL